MTGADDAAGLAVAGKMQSQLQGINMSIRGALDGVGMIHTADSGLNQILNKVQRVRELSVQMAAGIYEDTPDRDNAQLEVTALLDQISLISDDTKFNNSALIDGSVGAGGITVQAGNTIAETITMLFIDAGTTNLGINTAKVETQASATLAIGLMNTALQTIATEQATMGSLVNRLQYSGSNQPKASVRTELAIGRIMDANVTIEAAELMKNQILNQSATAMLAQANQSKGVLLKLLN
jgi:flagellin